MRPKRMLRLFPYFGAKHRYASSYPSPRHDLIIEPFAGSAAYSTLHRPKTAILIEKNERLAMVWDWLISVSEREFMALPTVKDYERVSETGLSGPPADYLRLWTNEASRCHFGDKVSSAVRRVAESYPRSRWTEAGKAARCEQLEYIRGWVAIHGCYSTAPDIEATWFIDPPYVKGGEYYQCPVSDIDHSHLAPWITSRVGQVIACEGDGADWLGFTRLRPADRKSHSNGAFGTGRRTELVYLSDSEHREIHARNTDAQSKDGGGEGA